MILILLGVALWWAAHLFKRLAPEPRARLGEPGKGMVALALLVSIVLMVIGYRIAGGPVWWGPSPALVGINNLLMLLAIYMYAVSGLKTWLGTKIRHPQLIGFKIWCLAHLLVNGDLASFILFGGLLAWAVFQMILINKQDGRDWTPVNKSTQSREIRAIVGTVVLTAVIMGVHHFLGATPWG